MANVPLNFKNLGDADNGRVGGAFELALRNAEADLRDRPTDERAREITLKIRLKPLHANGHYEGATLDYSVTSKTPHQEGNTIHMLPKRLDGKHCLIMPTLGTDANQPTMFTDDE